MPADVIAAHRPFVNSEIKGMLFAEDRFPKDGRSHRNIGFLHQLEDLILHHIKLLFDAEEAFTADWIAKHH